jgi:CHAD domain-containing protein/transposase
MEIEAKFTIPDEETFRRLQAAGDLAGFALSAGRVKRVRDTYVDTVERTILAAGYACRWREREQAEGVLLTLKGLGGAEGGVHRREELEALLPGVSPPAEWPVSPVRERVLQLIGDSSLALLFDLEQTRTVRLVSWGERPVAELSLDDVHLATRIGTIRAGGKQAYFELEVELSPQGAEEDLAAIVTCLRDEWELAPEPQSKFERALALFSPAETEVSVQHRLLTSREHTLCQQIAARDDLCGRRARALLALDEGTTQIEAGKRAGMSDRTVRYWLAAFREKRLDIFPARVLEQAKSELAIPPEPERPPEIEEKPEPWPLDTLFERYRVDQVHARAVADHALALFDHLLPFHGLPPERRPLLETAALVHNVGLETDPDRHHVTGRDILLNHPPAELGDDERLMVALTTFLYRKRITSNRLEELAQQSTFADLPELARNETLALAALVRLADGLDYTQTGSHLGQVQQREGAVEIEVTGPYAAMDADRAQRKSDLWRLLFDVDLRFSGARVAAMEKETALRPAPKQPVEPETHPLPDEPGLEADDSMAEAARKTFYFHYRRMLHNEPGTRLGQDIEELHDMRVATRRMRAAVRVFGAYLDLERMKPLIKGMRRTGRVLGAVRDLDVFWEKTQHYLDTLPSERQAELEPLRVVWQAQRERAREQMLAYLDSDRYIRFKGQLGEFLRTPGAGALPVISDAGGPLPHRLRHVVPVAIYQRLAAVRAYDEWVTRPDVPLERLHQLRIAAKGLRYTVEYFREVLGPEAEALIDEVKGLQDHLGDLQDAVVASNLLRDFLTWGTWGHAQAMGKRVSLPTELVIAPGVAAYLTVRQTELQHLLDTFPQVWVRVRSTEFGRLVAAMLTVL